MNYLNSGVNILYKGVKSIQKKTDYPIAYTWGKSKSLAMPYITMARETTWGSAPFNATAITDDIYIGDLASSCNLDELKKHGITHIISVVIGVDPIYPEEFTYKNIFVNDVEWADLSPYFDPCYEFIEDAIKSGGKVLVHCMCGVSRSTTIVASYLIKKRQMKADDVIAYIKSKRDCINPNPSFRSQLSMLAQNI